MKKLKEMMGEIANNPWMGVLIPYDTSNKLNDEEVEKFQQELALMRVKLKAKSTKGERKMTEKYLVLKDRKHKPRVIICLVEGTNSTGYHGTGWGMAIRSEEDMHSENHGKRLAFARARRAMLDRQPCYCVRTEAQKNIWSLKFEDFCKILYFSDDLMGNFPKSGFKYYDSVKDVLSEVRRYVSNRNG
jgi:hypothetical protein